MRYDPTLPLMMTTMILMSFSPGFKKSTVKPFWMNVPSSMPFVNTCAICNAFGKTLTTSWLKLNVSGLIQVSLYAPFAVTD